MKKYVYIILGLVGSLLLISSGARAEDNNDFVFTYQLYLFYNQGQITLDKKAKAPFDLVAEEFQPQFVESSKYAFEIRDRAATSLALYTFDPTNKGAITKGPFILKAPYFPNAQEFIISGGDGEILLSVNLAGASICNDNNVCESEYGETFTNCRNDCRASTPIIAPPSTGGQVSGSGDAQEGNSFIFLYILGGLFLVAGIVWIILRRARS